MNELNQNITSTNLSPDLGSTSGAVGQNTQKKNSHFAKTVGIVVGIILLIMGVGFGGYYLYLNYFGGAEIPTIAYVTKFIRDENGNVIRNPDYDPNDVVNEQLRDEDLGLGDYAPDPKIEKANSKAACEAMSGAQWCDYGFCMKNDGTQGNCNNRAVELGYTVNIGSANINCVLAPSNSCSTPPCFQVSHTQQDLYNDYPGALDKANALCTKGGGTIDFGNAKYICKEGVKGEGGIAYSGGACTALNGTTFTGNLGCFCGTVQVDTGSGHTSYSSTCGCESEPEPSEPPSITTPHHGLYRLNS